MKLITDVKLVAESQPDPYILAANGKFYIYMPQAVTEWCCTVPTIFSADMKNWEK